MFFKAIVAAQIVIAGLTAVFWIANWPFNTPWEEELTPEQRRIEAVHNRRHHRAVARLILPTYAILFGIASVSILAGPKSNWFGAAAMGVCSAVCAGLFVALIKRDRRRSSMRR